MLPRFFLCLALICLSPLGLSAAEDWLLTTADFRSQRVDLQQIDDTGALIASGEGAPQRIDWQHLLMLERAAHPTPTGQPAKFAAITIGNDRTMGTPAAIEGENLVWENPALGKLTIPLRSVSSIARSGSEPAGSASQAPRLEDSVRLTNGDVVKGIIVGIENGAVMIQQPSGDKTPVPLESVALINFASTGGKPPAPQRGFRVTLADETSVTAGKLQLDAAAPKLSMTLPDGQVRSIPMASVASIEQVHGPVVWLSTLEPSESIARSFLDLTWPARMDRAVDGSPIRFADRSFARGIGVHSYSLLTFAIQPEWKTFRTLYAVAGDLPYADMTVRIKLDDQVVHERLSLKAGVLQPPVVIDVAGHQRLSLEVDYGANFDVQDRMNWIEPAFLNFVPEKPQPPATAPTTREAQ
jgi:hypothetical protein